MRNTTPQKPADEKDPLLSSSGISDDEDVYVQEWKERSEKGAPIFILLSLYVYALLYPLGAVIYLPVISGGSERRGYCLGSGDLVRRGHSARLSFFPHPKIYRDAKEYSFLSKIKRDLALAAL